MALQFKREQHSQKVLDFIIIIIIISWQWPHAIALFFRWDDGKEVKEIEPKKGSFPFILLFPSFMCNKG